MKQHMQQRKIGRPLAVLALAALVGGYLLGWFATIADEQSAVTLSATNSSGTASVQAATPVATTTMIVADDGTALQEAPNPDAAVVAQLEADTIVTILEGPNIQDSVAWYRLDVGGLTGWATGAFLSPYESEIGMLDQQTTGWSE